MTAAEAYTALMRWPAASGCKSIPRHQVCAVHPELCGCTQGGAANYNPQAIINNGSCVFRQDACADYPCVNGGTCLNTDNMKPGSAR